VVALIGTGALVLVGIHRPNANVGLAGKPVIKYGSSLKRPAAMCIVINVEIVLNEATVSAVHVAHSFELTDFALWDI
jgi:hypothetical protein